MPKTVLVGAVEDMDPNSDLNWTCGHVIETEQINMVSVTLKSHKAGGELIRMLSLFHTGSPVSFMRHSSVPQHFETLPQPTKFRGLGNTRLVSLGKINAIMKFRNLNIEIPLIILPDIAMGVPFLGRDYLNKSNIVLCEKIKNENKLPLKRIQLTRPYSKSDVNFDPPDLDLYSPLFQTAKLNCTKFYDVVTKPTLMYDDCACPVFVSPIVNDITAKSKKKSGRIKYKSIPFKRHGRHYKKNNNR